jgi:hypothetical protein
MNLVFLGMLAGAIPLQRPRLRLPAQVRHPRRQVADVRTRVHPRRSHRPMQHVRHLAAVQPRPGEVPAHVLIHANQRAPQVGNLCST